MPSKSLNNLLLLGFLLAGSQLTAQAAELSTLFTTPEERQIINTNRYKSSQVEVEVVETGPQIEIAAQQLVREEVSFQYRVSGITISEEGPNTVWINSLAYEDGELLEDDSKIKVMAGDEIRVRITAPDGKQYYATSGEILDVTYLAPIKN